MDWMAAKRCPLAIVARYTSSGDEIQRVTGGPQSCHEMFPPCAAIGFDKVKSKVRRCVTKMYGKFDLWSDMENLNKAILSSATWKERQPPKRSGSPFCD